MRRQSALPKFVQAVRKKGRAEPYLYFRFSDGRRAPLPSDHCSPDFHRRYAELLAQRQLAKQEPSEGSVGALIASYLATPAHKALSAHTQWHHRKLLDHLAPIVVFPVTDIRRKHVRELRDALADRPRTADVFLQVVRRLFKLAVDDEWIDINPASGIERLGGGGHYRAWTDIEAETFEAACKKKKGEKGAAPQWAYTVYLLGRYTAQRRGDVLRMTWAAYDGRAIRLKQDKTGAALVIPAHPTLKTHLDSLPRNTLLICTSPTGKAWDPRNFTREFREVLDKLGLRGISFHGLRHMVSSELATRGASTHTIKALTGHRSTESVEIYTEAANQERLAEEAVRLLGPRSGNPASRRR